VVGRARGLTGPQVAFGDFDEWLTIENEFFIIKYHMGQEEDAEEALTCTMWCVIIHKRAHLCDDVLYLFPLPPLKSP